MAILRLPLLLRVLLAAAAAAVVVAAAAASKPKPKPPPAWAISGSVTGAAAVTVTLDGGVRRTATTDRKGRYRFSDVAPGAYTLTPSLAGYAFTPARRLVQVSRADVAGQDFQATALPPPSPTHAISGVVSGAGPVLVTLGGAASASTSTDAGGRYAFTGLADGAYTVTPALTGYAFAPRSRAVSLAGADAAGQDFGAVALPGFDGSPVAQQDPGSALPADWTSGVFMEIYVRGYRDSDGDGVGDLRGVTQSLDYLQSLGVSGLWLMPIMRSQDHDHGYAIADYREVEADYGSLADLDELVAQAHARGIGVILDYVLNHSARQHPAFVNSDLDPAGPYRSWYLWQDPKPTGWDIYGQDPWRAGADGWFFATFWDQMPDFDLTNPAVVAFHDDNLRFWLNRGVDGFRFDSVANLVESGPQAFEGQPLDYALMGDVRQLVAGYAQRFMVCEAPPDPAGFAAACGSAFALGHNYDIVGAALDDPAAVARTTAYFTYAPPALATLISNHDTYAGQRVYDQVGGDLAAYRLAAATYLLEPGTPFIYYGEEIGMAGAAGLTGDWKLRTPMSWTGDPATAGFTAGAPFRELSANSATFNVEAESADPGSLLSFYRDLIALRRAHPALSRGSYLAAWSSGDQAAFQREDGGERLLVAFNYGPATSSVLLPGLPASATLTPLYAPSGTASASDAAGDAVVALGARSFAIFTVGAPGSAAPPPPTFTAMWMRGGWSPTWDASMAIPGTQSGDEWVFVYPDGYPVGDLPFKFVAALDWPTSWSDPLQEGVFGTCVPVDQTTPTTSGQACSNAAVYRSYPGWDSRNLMVTFAPGLIVRFNPATGLWSATPPAPPGPRFAAMWMRGAWSTTWDASMAIPGTWSNGAWVFVYPGGYPVGDLPFKFVSALDWPTSWSDPLQDGVFGTCVPVDQTTPSTSGQACSNTAVYQSYPGWDSRNLMVTFGPGLVVTFDDHTGRWWVQAP